MAENHLNTKANINEIVEKLTNIGLMEGLKKIGRGLSSKLQNFENKTS